MGLAQMGDSLYRIGAIDQLQLRLFPQGVFHGGAEDRMEGIVTGNQQRLDVHFIRPVHIVGAQNQHPIQVELA
ncbi:hypothetical protein D3C81_2212500 [compost metagenome]